MRGPAFVGSGGLVVRAARPGVVLRPQRSLATCAVAPAADAASSPTMAIEVGARVRVNRSIIMFHFPGKRNEETDIAGFEGVVIKDVSTQGGQEVSATAPYVVKFPDHDPRFKAHLAEHELDVLE